MKVEIEILEDQIDLLNRIRSLPKLIEERIGKFPQAFPGSAREVDDIQQAVANLEFKCKKMIFDTCIVKERLADILNDTDLSSDKFRSEDWD